ncbi:MAG: hypothetical protein OEM99_03695 [Gammaproteobacteria bacterium]|nr:hypothetical protein [Gammaproteobacteria bacterium]
MGQSILAANRNISAENQSSENSKSDTSRLWLAIMAKGSALISNIWRLRFAFSPGNSESLDINAIAARLNVEKRAEFDGRNDQPPPAEEGLSGTQREIVVYFRELQRKAQHRVIDLAEKLRRLGEDIDLSGVGGSLRDIPSRCENNVLRLIAESHSQLNLLAEQEVQQQQFDAALIDKDPQNQGADRPISPIFQGIFLAALISIGALAIAKSSITEFGTTGFMPPSWAIAIALIVVLGSSVIARIITSSVNHAERIGHSANWLGSGLGVVLIVVMAFLAAYYISVVAIDPTASVRSVVDSFLADPIAIVSNFTAWKSFGIVAAAGLMAFLLNYRQDASHPSHGGRQSHIYRTRKKRDRLTKRLRMQINTIIDEADAEVTELPKRLKMQISQYSSLVEESKRIPASLGDYDVFLEDSCSILLDRYRAANINARKSEVPMSFSEHVCFRPELEPNFSVFDKEQGRLDQFRNGVAEIEKDAVEVRQKLRELNSRAIGTLEEFVPDHAD